ncbi:MAG: aminopeptidase [Bacteroidetes bacterium]|nr:aminopeptidase [Bacteroidota bacterium]
MKKIYSTIFLILIFTCTWTALAQNPFKFTIVKNIEATEVKNQGNTGTCWSFSTSSFVESEILRISGKKIDLSEMFVARKIYLEKAENYLRFWGKANFSQGGLAHDYFNVIDKYGLMPETVYNGKKNSNHNHSLLEISLKNYLDSILKFNTIDPHWKENFETILDKFLGACPALFTYEGKEYSAKSFAESLNLKTSDYLGFTSYTHHPFYKNFILEIPDNFSRGQYFNAPIETLIDLINSSIDKGYSVVWDGDVSETGFLRDKGVAVLLPEGILLGDSLPIEQIPSQQLRQYTFDNHETADDHLMQITGIANDQKGNKYFITKNSWGKKSGIEGYVYMSEKYIMLKTVSIYINKNAITPEINKQFEIN